MPTRDGSPPLARGQVIGVSESGCLRRFTPARAGTGPARARRLRPGSVHPRSRGDRAVELGPVDLLAGSPPLARGQVVGAVSAEVHPRFTPARAGTGTGPPAVSRPGTVHPRSRGDRDTDQGRYLRSLGSPPLARGQGSRPGRTRCPRAVHPPLARGQGLQRVGECFAGRFTPARAGTGRAPSPRT